MELTDREQLVLEQLELLVRMGMTVDDAAAKLGRLTEDDESVAKVVAYRQQIVDGVLRLAQRNAITDPEDDSKGWYRGPTEGDLFWPGLRDTLESDPGWARAVPSLDSSSTDIVSLLADPHSPLIGTRGLVLGHVQSGKTANFTATIAKAADAGYRLFIVLSGVHNALRRQTQLRLDDQLASPHPTKWLQLTDESRDFGSPVKAIALMASTDLRLLAVVKKNAPRLERLKKWLYDAHSHGGLDTCPVLIIDDESDQASPNSAKNPDLDRTAINNLLVDLLKLPRVAYIGYTATPFANVLINPEDANDIYPRSFIYALDKPDGYFGSRELFGAPVSEDEASENDAPHDMIRIVPVDEARQHAPKELKDNGPEITKCLGTAVDWFVLATTARRLRDGRARHSSMLVHTTMNVEPQKAYLPLIRKHLERMKAAIDKDTDDRLRTLWADETTKEPAARHGHKPISYDELSPLLVSIIDEVKVVADNSKSEERLIYGDDPATVIAVGGNTLSRGLTLEGLISSYFLRSSSMYDALLQMGRWFGYRVGYEDLPRIWTTRQLFDDFDFLADVEDGLRTEIDRYQTIEGANPMTLPVRILRHPRMKATSKSKLHFSVTGSASYSGQRPQTTYFDHLTLTTINKNLSAVRNLIADVKSAGIVEEDSESNVVLRDVDYEHITTFIETYRFHKNSELDAQLLTSYIENQAANGALKRWNVVVVGIKDPIKEIDLGLSSPSPLISRSRLGRSDAGVANIGTLMSRPDRVADLTRPASMKTKSDKELMEMRNDSETGLLLIYPIFGLSKPKAGTTYRVDLQATGDLIGVAFSFPEAAEGTEPSDTIQVDPALLSRGAEADELPYVDDEGFHEVDLGDGHS